MDNGDVITLASANTKGIEILCNTDAIFEVGGHV